MIDCSAYGVRTARMTLHSAIPSRVNIAGEIIKIWYPGQPKTCRNCGADDYMAKDCLSIRCFNCKLSGHHSRDCTEPEKCSVCMAADHHISACPFVLFSANIDSDAPRQPKTAEEIKKEKEDRAKRKEEAKRKLEQEPLKQQQEKQPQQQQQQQQER